MKTLLFIIVALVGVAVVGLIVLAQQSKTITPQLGVQNNRLLPCQLSSNCVNTMDDSAIASLHFDGDAAEAWQRILHAVEQLGGKVERHEGGYVWATFRTPLFGFVDDVEFLMEPQTKQIHIRSASRVGRSDFSANRKRIARIAELFANLSFS